MVWKWGHQLPGIRYQNRQVPLWMRINIHDGKCWCGKEFKWPRRKYCCGRHANLFYFSIRAYWESFRLQAIERDNYTCTECGFHTKDTSKFDVDHIQAIALGGFCFDLDNVRTLCKECHKIKTKNDLSELKRERRKIKSIEAFCHE